MPPDRRRAICRVRRRPQPDFRVPSGGEPRMDARDAAFSTLRVASLPEPFRFQTPSRSPSGRESSVAGRRVGGPHRLAPSRRQIRAVAFWAAVVPVCTGRESPYAGRSTQTGTVGLGVRPRRVSTERGIRKPQRPRPPAEAAEVKHRGVSPTGPVSRNPQRRRFGSLAQP